LYPGNNTVDYSERATAVAVDLSASTNTDSDVFVTDTVGTTAGVASIQNIRGGSGNDTLTGDDNANSIWGGDGDDIILGKGGNDSLYGEAGNDTITGGAGDDYIIGGPGRDRMYGDEATGYTTYATDNPTHIGTNFIDAQDGWADLAIDGGPGGSNVCVLDSASATNLYTTATLTNGSEATPAAGSCQLNL
jgi:Ca2+-binding RTX toxin-like protein